MMGRRTMAEYRYEALDIAGQPRAGRIHAPSQEAARADLLDKRLFATKLETAGGPQAYAAPRGNARLNPGALSLFTRQLATLATVAPLEEALRTIVRQTEGETARAVLTNVHGAVVEGRRLSDAMALEGQSFPPL